MATNPEWKPADGSGPCPVERWFVGHNARYDYWAIVRINRDGGSHSKGCASKEEAEAKLAAMAAVGTCRECGDVLNDEWMEPEKTEVRAKQTCFECLFWLKYVASKATPTHVVVKGHHYVIAPDNPRAAFQGHGGAEFVIRFNDGREVVTHNLWAQGSVPELFRDRLPNNAVFVQRGHKRIGPFAGYGGAGSADAECAMEG